MFAIESRRWRIEDADANVEVDKLEKMWMNVVSIGSVAR